MTVHPFVIYGVIAAFVAYAMFPKVKALFATLREETAAKLALAEALRKVLESEALTQGYIKGLVAVCERQVALIDRHTAAVERFAELVAARPDDVADQVTEYDPDRADAAWLKQDLTRKGFAAGEAARMAAQELAVDATEKFPY